jgi:hypothetical protein
LIMRASVRWTIRSRPAPATMTDASWISQRNERM